jgi:hypothetical protein
VWPSGERRASRRSGCRGGGAGPITGTNVALSAGAGDFCAAIIGVIAGVGGIIRDVLAG